MWDGAGIIELVRDRAELDAANTLMTDAVLLRLINVALRQLSLDADWPWLRAVATAATVGGDATLGQPTGWVRTILLTHDDTAEPLTRAHLKIVRRISAATQGRPTIYAVDGSVITLRAVPDRAYSLTHDYVRVEPNLASTASVPLIPEAYGQGVVEYAAIKAFQKQQKTEKAMEAKADYAAWKKRVLDNINQGREPLSMTPRPGAWF